MLELSGPEFSIINVLTGDSTFRVQGDTGGGSLEDIQRHARLTRDATIAATESLSSKRLVFKLEDGRIQFSLGVLRDAHKEQLENHDRGLARKILCLLAEHCEKPGALLGVDGINRILGMDDQNAYAIYNALRQKDLIAIEPVNNANSFSASYGVYLKPETIKMVHAWMKASNSWRIGNLRIPKDDIKAGAKDGIRRVISNIVVWCACLFVGLAGWFGHTFYSKTSEPKLSNPSMAATPAIGQNSSSPSSKP